MNLISQWIVLASVFALMLGIVQAIPYAVTFYRERLTIHLNRVSRELNKFFFNIKPIYILGAAGLAGIVIGALSGSWIFAGAICLSGAFAPKIALTIWRGIRSRQFEAQFMDALILLGNSLKSGLDMAAGIDRIATTMKPPISEEFGLVMNAYRLGTPLESSLMDLTKRIDSRTLETAVYAINIQRETGGNIIKTFDQLIQTIREESKLQKKVDAMTSQGRTQIFFLAGFPWLLAALFYVVAPDFMQPALANPWGQLTLVFLVFWEIIGIVVTKRIVSVDV